MFYGGEQVVLQDCQYSCQCVVNEGYSFFMCEPLCKGYYDVMCADGEEPLFEMEDSSVPECKCPKYYCPERHSIDHFIEYVSFVFYCLPVTIIWRRVQQKHSNGKIHLAGGDIGIPEEMKS